MQIVLTEAGRFNHESLLQPLWTGDPGEVINNSQLHERIHSSPTCVSVITKRDIRQRRFCAELSLSLGPDEEMLYSAPGKLVRRGDANMEFGAAEGPVGAKQAGTHAPALAADRMSCDAQSFLALEVTD